MSELCDMPMEGSEKPCTRRALHPGDHDWSERDPSKDQPLPLDGSSICFRIGPAGELCTRALHHYGECDPGERTEFPQPAKDRLPLVYLDIETGGLGLDASILQVALITPGWLAWDGTPHSFTSFVRPEHGLMHVDPEALAYNGIDLRGATSWPAMGQVALSMKGWALQHFTGKMVACGFNVRFDVDRMNMICPGLFSHRVLDLTAAAMFHGLPCKSKELIERFGIPSLRPHDAFNDARQAAEVHEGMRKLCRDAVPERNYDEIFLQGRADG